MLSEYADTHSASVTRQSFDKYLKADYVLCKDFLGKTVVLPEDIDAEAFREKGGLATVIGTWAPINVLCLDYSKCQKGYQLPPGPYIVLGNGIHQAWRLHEDY